jgi:hypothetical protein
MGKPNPTNPWFTWKGMTAWPSPTEVQCLQSCIGNAEEAAWNEKIAQARYDRSVAGTEDCRKAREQILRYQAEQKHWREYAEWYRRRTVIDVVPVPTTRALPPKSREVGEDDDQDEDERNAS